MKRALPPRRISAKREAAFREAGHSLRSTIAPRTGKDIARSFLEKRKAIRRKPVSAAKLEAQYGTPSRRRWVKSLPCCACKAEGYSQNAHVGRRQGTACKLGPETVAPLCGPRPCNRGSLYIGCHRELDSGKGREWLESTYRINLEVEAARTESAWQSFLATGGDDAAQ